MSAQTLHPSAAEAHRSRFSGRALVVFGVGFSFLAMAVSGLMLFMAPKGRTANMVDWTLFGAGRGDWEAIHIAMSLLFLGFCLWHLALHLRVVRQLLAGTPIHPQGHPRELALALGLVAFVVVAALAYWPPASWLVDLNLFFKHSFWLPG